jgi:protein TonB
MMLDWYARRDHVSRLAALLVVGLLLSPLLKYRPTVKTKSADAAILVQLSALVELPEPPAPLPAITPPPERMQPTPMRQPVAVATATAVEPPLRNATSLSAIPAAPALVPALAQAAAPTPVAVSAPVNRSANAEEGYVSAVRSYLNGIKRYPTGREASVQRPRGKARVWFVLGRDGRLLDAGIDASSDSLLLDRTALATVQRGGFPSFPEAAWSGQSNHRFTVELEFVPTG